jgi:RES domain-containing protein
MKQEGAFAEALQLAPTRKLQATLVRRVPLSPLIESGHVDYLFMSGRPYRFNTAGVRCIYFAEDEATAAAEYERHTSPFRQPVATYFAEVALGAVLDLCSTQTLEAVGMTRRHLRVTWVRARRPTVAQLLGEAVSLQTRISAIRFPSEAARLKGCAGANVVIFRDCVRRPDFLRILGPTRKPLQHWPT